MVHLPLLVNIVEQFGWKLAALSANSKSHSLGQEREIGWTFEAVLDHDGLLEDAVVGSVDIDGITGATFVFLCVRARDKNHGAQKQDAF